MSKSLDNPLNEYPHRYGEGTNSFLAIGADTNIDYLRPWISIYIPIKEDKMIIHPLPMVTGLETSNSPPSDFGSITHCHSSLRNKR